MASLGDLNADGVSDLLVVGWGGNLGFVEIVYLKSVWVGIDGLLLTSQFDVEAESYDALDDPNRGLIMYVADQVSKRITSGHFEVDLSMLVMDIGADNPTFAITEETSVAALLQADENTVTFFANSVGISSFSYTVADDAQEIATPLCQKTRCAKVVGPTHAGRR